MATRKKTAARKKTAKKPARKSTARKSASRKSSTRKKSTKKAARKKSSGKKRTPSAAFMRPVQPDNALSAVVGSSPMPRTELTKKLWAYIKRNGLQDSKNRRAINADDKLRPVFGGRSQVSMFDMTKLVNKHVS
ncbi:MAG TPA: SWIB/MDM2 domain-containing protein [Gemmatimonadales bacterium]